MTPPAMAPAFDDFFVRLLLSWPLEVLVGPAAVDDSEPEPLELPDNETVEGTGEDTSG